MLHRDLLKIYQAKISVHIAGCHITPIGQRRSLGVALGKPQYVIDIIPQTNTLVIGDNHLLFHRGVCADNINCLSDEGFLPDKPYRARIRYRHKECPGHIVKVTDDTLEFLFDQTTTSNHPRSAVSHL